MQNWQIFLLFGLIFTLTTLAAVLIYFFTIRRRLTIHKVGDVEVDELDLPRTVEIQEGHDDGGHVDGHTHEWTYDGPKGPEHWHTIDGDTLVYTQPIVHYRAHLPNKNHQGGNAEIQQVDAANLESDIAHGPVSTLTSGSDTKDKCEPIAHYSRNNTAKGQEKRMSRGVLMQENSVPKVADTGHSIQINMPPSTNENLAAVGGHVNFLGQMYHLRQIHFHSPSEHIIHGMAHRMEAHFVHANENGGLLVIGMFIVKAEVHEQSVTFLDSIMNEIPKSTSDAPRKLDWLDLKQAEFLIRSCPSYYLYDGSLTTPPCTEGVHWIVCNMTFPMKGKLIEAIENRMPAGNARPAFSSEFFERVKLVWNKTYPRSAWTSLF